MAQVESPQNSWAVYEGEGQGAQDRRATRGWETESQLRWLILIYTHVHDTDHGNALQEENGATSVWWGPVWHGHALPRPLIPARCECLSFMSIGFVLGGRECGRKGIYQCPCERMRETVRWRQSNVRFASRLASCTALNGERPRAMTLAQTRFPHHFFFSPVLQLSSPACFVLDLPDSLACLTMPAWGVMKV